MLAAVKTELPIARVRSALLLSIEQGPVVLSSPTGSGKSTEVPRWCEGRTLVVEPRRIACRSLAVRVAELEGTALGDGVGYLVRDERVVRDDTRIVFATPGMVLRDRRLIEHAHTVVLDEFHERSLEVDLLLALLLRRQQRRLIVMSATLDGERVASHIGGVHLSAEGRAFEVDVRYLGGPDVLPDTTDLPNRVRRALDTAARDPGDVLVFLPGKAEIEACAQSLRGNASTLVPLHGALSLNEQRRAFAPAPNRKIILATNVAETSLTIPGIGVVIDTGLVRQTHYHEGRAHLALGPIAEDSAAQRTGRAGRTAAGICYRLWSQAARLQPHTAPGIHRESLVPLVLAAAAWGERAEDLPLLDAPKPYALEAARADLRAWGALDAQGALSEGGHGMFALPVDALQARLLTTARSTGCLEDMIDLVAALSVGRPIFLSAPSDHVDEDDLRSAGCDLSALIAAMRSERPSEQGISGLALDEARRARARLRRMESLPDVPAVPRGFDRELLLRTAIAADPRIAYVARVRGRDTFFSNGGTELELSRESAARNLRTIEALLVLDTRAFGSGREARVFVTCAAAITLSAIARAGLGHDRLAGVQLDRKRVVAKIERVYAKRVIAEREELPQGELARLAIATLLERGSLFRDAIQTTRGRLARSTLAAQLATRGHAAGVKSDTPTPELSAFLLARLLLLGVESGEDLALLSASDFLAPELPYEVRSLLDRDFPETVSVGDASYRAEYDLAQNQVILHMVKGSRSDPPKLAYLPRFPGLRIAVAGPRGVAVIRARGAP